MLLRDVSVVANLASTLMQDRAGLRTVYTFRSVWVLVVMAAGVFVSGARDLYAAARLPHGDWPWRVDRAM